MAHGMGAQKDIGLWMYAERFCESGMAVVAFDYRCFGGSTGLPRHWVSPKRHLQDFEAVLQHVQVGGVTCWVDAPHGVTAARGSCCTSDQLRVWITNTLRRLTDCSGCDFDQQHKCNILSTRRL
jgi:hypothetical protein